MTDQIPSAGALRKEVYGFLSDNGMQLNPDAQSKLSEILKRVYEHRVIESPASLPPREHLIVCPDCHSKKVMTGKEKVKQVIKRARASGRTVQKEEKEV